MNEPTVTVKDQTVEVGTTLKSASLSAVVTVGPETAARLGVPVGTEIPLGVISYWHRNPLIRWWRQAKIALRTRNEERLWRSA